MTDLERCYAAALRILSYRFNSTAELRQKLRAKKYEENVVAEVLQRLRDERWLDDERYAAAYVRTRQNKKVGSRRIARELNAAGVDDETARMAIRENADKDRERDDLLALCRKRHLLMVRRKGEEYASSFEGRNKLAGYLLNQGYDGALVREAIDEVLRAHDR
jgi:regulatory protein